MIFANRHEAGRTLAKKLAHFADRADVLILALPRGGVPVASEIASALRVRMELFVVRKLGVPGHEELAMGAIASGGACYLNRDLISRLGIPDHRIQAEIELEKQELTRREEAYHCDQRPLTLKDRTVILVDDGLATGASMRAAIAAVRSQQPKATVVAVPVVAAGALSMLQRQVDQLVYVTAPENFEAVGKWYQEFEQTTDDEVRELLHRHTSPLP